MINAASASAQEQNGDVASSANIDESRRVLLKEQIEFLSDKKFRLVRILLERLSRIEETAEDTVEGLLSKLLTFAQ